VAFFQRVMLWFLLATLPVYACDPLNGFTVAYPIFAIAFVAMFASWATGWITRRVGRPLGLMARLGVAVVYILVGAVMAAFMLHLSFSAIPFLYIWVIYRILRLCLEFLFREEKGLGDFYRNHRELVGMGLFLLLGGLAMKGFLYLGDPSEFMDSYDMYSGNFLLFLVIGLGWLAVLIPVYGFRRVCKGLELPAVVANPD